jgi:hypothetical protein
MSEGSNPDFRKEGRKEGRREGKHYIEIIHPRSLMNLRKVEFYF